VIRRHRAATVIVLCLVIGMVVLIIRWSRPAPKPASSPSLPVSAATVKLGSIDIYLDGLGTVTPVYTATVASRVAGEVTKVSYTEGQMVKKNDLLALIDPRPYQALLEQARGQLARDEASLKNARLDLVRYQNSYKVHAVSEQQLATQQALVEQYIGTVDLDRGNLAAAQINVDYTRIVSPIDGRVGLRTVDPGNIVPADGTTGLAVITQLKPITVIFTLAEDDLDQVTEQLSAGHTLSVLALDRTRQHTLSTGSLITVDNQINTTTGTVRARAIFANTHNELFPNQFVNARLLVKTLENVDLIPQAAIQRSNDAAFVYVIGSDMAAQSRNVQIQATEGGVVAVKGVNPGEQVVTDGFEKLQTGMKVQIRPAAPANPPADSNGSAPNAPQ